MSAPIFGKPYVVALPGLLSAANPGAYAIAPVINPEDIKVYRNNVLVPAGLTTLPQNDPPGSPRLRLQFTADEMACEQLQVYLHSLGGLWSDVSLEITPRSSLNSGYVDLVLGFVVDNGASIKVRKTGAIASGQPDGYGVRLKLEVTETAGIDKEIFIYQQRPLDVTAGTFVGDFNHVCSPTDMGNYPVNQAQTEVSKSGLPQFYRSHFVDLLFDSIADADEAEQALWEDIFLLKLNVDRLSRLTSEQVVVVGPPAGIANSVIDLPTPPPAPPQNYGTTQSTQASPTMARSLGHSLWAAWNVQAQTVVVPAGKNSQYLLLQGFDFSAIPETAKLVGLTVALSFDSAPPARLEWLMINLPDGPAGDNLAEDIAAPAAEALTHNYEIVRGSDAELLGTNATTANVKRGEFGLMALVDSPYEVDGAAAITAVAITAHWKPVL